MNVLSVAVRRAITPERGGRQRVMVWRKRRTVKREQRWWYSLQTGPSWLACLWALRSLWSVCFSESLKRTAVFSVTPCECCRTGPAGPNVNRNTYTHAQTHTHKHTWASTGGWRERREWGGRGDGGGAQGFISGGMLLVSRDAHFICNQKNKWVLRPWSSWRTKYFPPPRFTLELYLRTLSQLPSILCTPLLHQSSPPFSCGITPKLSLTLTLSLLSAVPLCPHVTPICVSCMFCDSETIFSSRAWAIPE